MNILAAPHIIGIRHHSPACARLVAQRIEQLRPAHVLIEGPADFNHRHAELALPHRLPIAIYSYLSTDRTHRASWSPFVAHSPEWQALSMARACGARANFIDLPSWHDAFCEIENRYADAADAAEAEKAAGYNEALCLQLGLDGMDALWDHLFEDDIDSATLAERLGTYFKHLRGLDPGSEGNQAREQMMARWIAWAMARNDGPVLVVCGGYHAPALEKLWRTVGETRAQPPDIPQPELDPNVRFGSFLVPYSYHRLDAFSGYASGMASPYFYQLIWDHGVQAAGAHALQRITQHLRAQNFQVSSADLIATHARAHALARLRGHALPLRCDWLDGMAGTLQNDALQAPLPWTQKHSQPGHADALPAAIMRALAGDQAGALAPGTPQPPLVASVEAELAAHRIVAPSMITLDLLQAQDRAKSRLLHRLLLLDLPGIERQSGPRLALEGERQEIWQLRATLEQRAALIEAAAYGATVADAARAKLEERLRAAAQVAGKSRLRMLTEVLNQAAFAGLSELSPTLLDQLALAIAGEARFEAIGMPLAFLHLLLRHGQGLAFADAPLLHSMVVAAFDRALWLLEAPGLVHANEQWDHIDTHVALRALVREVGQACEGMPIVIEPARALAVWQRKLADPQAAAVSRGAALGALASLARDDDDARTTAPALALLRTLPAPQMGDALTGLLALARNQLAHQPQFVAGINAIVSALDHTDFLLALPAMRAAFAWLPPAERAALAEAVLTLHNMRNVSARVLTAPLVVAADEQARALQLEHAALRKLAAYGIVP